jgi:hypothetical protein
VYEADLVNPFIRKYARSTNPSHQFCLIMILTRCLHALRAYFDSFLTINYSEYSQLSLNQWIGLTYAIVLLYKLSLGVTSVPAWDVQLARSFAPLHTYLEECIRSMDAALKLTTCDENEVERRDLYSQHVHIWRDTLHTYLRKRDSSACERLASSSMAVHQRIQERGRALRDEWTTLPAGSRSVGSICPARNFWK